MNSVFASISRKAVGTSQPPNQQTLEALTTGVKQFIIHPHLRASSSLYGALPSCPLLAFIQWSMGVARN
jgi:hypothetical protein